MKNFDHWNEVKQKLDQTDRPPSFNEGEIWWCSVGINVGYEIFGKDELYTRPILIIKKFSSYTFFGLPLTSKRKEKPSHYPLEFNRKQGSVILDQGKTLDARRLADRMGSIGRKSLSMIVEEFKRQF